MFANGDALRVGRYFPHPWSGLFRGESQGRFHIGIFGEILGARQIDSAARGIQMEGALLCRLQFFYNVVGVVEKEWRSVDEHGVAIFRSPIESPEDRLRECLLDRFLLGVVVGYSAVALVFRDQENARAAALEMHDLCLARLSAVKPDIVRA